MQCLRYVAFAWNTRWRVFNRDNATCCVGRVLTPSALRPPVISFWTIFAYLLRKMYLSLTVHSTSCKHSLRVTHVAHRFTECCILHLHYGLSQRIVVTNSSIAASPSTSFPGREKPWERGWHHFSERKYRGPQATLGDRNAKFYIVWGLTLLSSLLPMQP